MFPSSEAPHGAPVRASATLLVAAIWALFIFAMAPAAQAHAFLDHSDPASGATVSGAPMVVHLWFSEDIASGFSSARLVDAKGRAVAGTRMVPSPSDTRQVLLSVPMLGQGAYAVLWQVLSQGDGHSTQGTLVFTVGAPGSRVTPSVLVPSGSASRLEVIIRWLAFCLLAGVIGGLSVIGYVIASAERVGHRQLPALRSGATRIARFSFYCAGGAAFVGLVALLQETRQVTPYGTAASMPATLGHLVASTRWGHLWVGREMATLGVAACLFLVVPRAGGSGRRRQQLLVSAAGLALAIVVFQALDSHAASVGSSRILAVGADALHLLTASIWVGGLLALMILLWPAGQPGATRSDLIQACRGAFSRLALTGALLVAVTGLYSAGRQVDTVKALTSSTYGHTLLIKSVLLVVIVVFGAINAIRMHGRRGSPSRRLVMAEAVVGSALLLSAAFLTSSAPARGAAAVASAPASKTLGGTMQDLVVSVTISPNVPGANGFTVLAESTRRPAPAPIEGVAVVLTSATGTSLVPLEEVEAGRYFATASLTTPGPRSLVVVVHRAGQSINLPLSWSLLPSAPRAAPPAAGRPLAPWVDAGALVLLALGAAAAVIAWAVGRRRRPARRQTESSQDEGVPVLVATPSSGDA